MYVETVKRIFKRIVSMKKYKSSIGNYFFILFKSSCKEGVNIFKI